MKKFILAPDSFKESMRAKEVCIAMEKGIRKVMPDVEVIHVPMADGGEGTLQALIDSTNGEIFYKEVLNPLGNKIKARFGILGDKKTAIIEMAEASGLELINKEERNPMITTSYGTGELIKAALDFNVNTIVIGLGGSATNDAGVGMLQALGGRFLDDNNKEVHFGGGELHRIKKIDLSNFDKRIENVKIEVACDVKNTLTGKNGASYIFARQKGAHEKMIEILDSNLKSFANVVKNTFNIDIDNIEGAGAAGGMGASLVGFCGGELNRGIDIVIKYSKLEELIKGADYIFTGEGSIDAQTKFGKTISGIAMLGKKYNIPVIALGGKVDSNINELYELGVTAAFGILNSVMTLEEALKGGKENIESTTENIVRMIKTNL
ncbi:glycerate kinase [Clostridium sp. AL.422]|uniref:glycerate kinase n=1 Tax=Clostridium TaxID=1485 RepID=UPI00293DABC5|nr:MULTISPECIES: glycerate kinase [unclassified Clostridium]MDV4149374.1 glycerate kinase [Clostridium sp. AL.422]